MRHKLLTVLVTIAVVALFACSAEAATKGKGPVLHMRFDEGGGATSYDEGWTDTDSDGIKDSGESWNNNDGTLTPGDNTGSNDTAGEMWSRQGKIGSAFECDGTNDYIDCGNNSSLTMTDYLTVEAWIKGTTLNNQSAIVARSTGRSPWNLGQYSSNTIWVALTWSDDTYQDYHVGSLTAGRWHHIVFTLSYNTGSVKIYQDGKEVGDYTKNAGLQLKTTTTAVYIGGNKTFDGLVDEVKIYDYVRTPAQIAVDYNVGSASHLSAGTDPNKGNPPTGYWPLDENTGTTAYDRSGSGNNGTITNAPWVQGKYGTALSYDGNDYVTIPNTNNTAIPASNAAFTLSLWFNSSELTTSTIKSIAYNEIYQNSGFRYGTDENRKLRFWSLESGGGIQVISSTVLVENRWYHAAIVYTGSSVKMYLDGVEVASDGSGTVVSNTTTIKIGESIGGKEKFKGLIDEIKIYDYARTATQVIYDYNRGAPVAHYRFDEGAGTIAKNDSSSAHDGAAPVGWWRMDESAWNGTANEVVDSSGNANHGVRVGNATTSSSSKIGPYCGTFDGTGDYVSISNWGAVPAQFTVTQWVNLTGSNSYYPSFSLAQDYDYGFTIHGVNGRIEGGNGPANSYDTSNMFGESLVGDGWRFIAVTYDGSIFRAYLDGVAKNILSFSIGHPSSTYTLKIGDFWSTEFQGQIDDTRFYDYVRTPEQVYNDYKSTHGTFVGDATFSDGKIGKGLSLDGTGDYVAVNNPPTIGTSGITVSAWVYYNVAPTTGWQYAIATQDDSTTRVFQLSTYNKRFMWHRFAETDVVGDTDIVVDRWYYVAATFDGTNHKIYVDGVLKDQETGTLISSSTVPVEIGRKGSGEAWSYFNGKIDDVRIYRYARTAAQIAEDYADGAARLGAQAIGIADPWSGALPVIHWKLDENTGVLARDASENANDGRIYGSTWTQGKKGPCLSLAGTASSYAIKNPISNFPTSEVSVAFWMKTSSADNRHPFSYASTASDNEFLFNYNCQNILIGGTQYNTSVTYNDGNWHYVVVTWKSSDGAIRVYKDGILVSSGTHKQGYTLTAGGSLVLGQDQDSVGGGFDGNQAFNGLIDDVGVYNYILTQAQVSWLYNTGKPVGYWRMDEAITGAANGSTIYDDMQSNNITADDGANNTGMTWAAGKFGGALSFDGVDDKAESSGITGVRSSTGTISYWIKPTTKDKTGGPFHLYENSTADYIRSYIGAGNRMDLAIEDEDVVYVNAYYDLDNLGAFENKWWHVTWVQDGSSVKLYINGGLKTLTGTNSGSWWTDHLASSLTLKFGNAWAAFQGLMDDLRIYNYVRTADQIKQDYNNGVASKLSD